MKRALPFPFLKVRRDRHGSAALEFAILGPIFFLLSFGLLELCLFQLRLQSVDQMIVQGASRAQLGQIEDVSDLCPNTPVLLSCADIRWDLRTYTSLKDIKAPPIKTDDNGDPTGFRFERPGPGEYVVLRAATKHTFITPMMPTLAGVPRDTSVLANGIAVVQTEQW